MRGMVEKYDSIVVEDDDIMIEEDAEEAPRPAAKRGKSAPAAPRGRKPQAPEEGAGAEPAPKKKRAPPKKKDPNPEEGKDGPGEVAEGAGAELAPKKKRAPAKKKTAAVAEGGAEGAGAGALGAEGAGEEGGEAKPSKGRGRGAGAGKRSKSAPGTPGEAEAAEAAAEGEGTKKKKAPRKKKKKEAEGEEGEEDEEGGEGEDDGPYQVYDDQDASESDWEEPIIPELEPPACVTAPLLPYQKEFLHWAVKQEKGPIRGGLLADEMGLGKTIQAISLICAHRTDALHPELADKRMEGGVTGGAGHRHQGGCCGGPGAAAAAAAAPSSAAAPSEEEAKPSAKPASKGKGKAAKPPPSWEQIPFPHVEDDGTDGPVCRATLVVCPVVAVIQWRGEVDKWTAPGSVKVAVYQGAKRGKMTREEVEELKNADIVVTTYSTLEADYRKNLMPGKVACPYCDKKLQPEKIRIHLKYFCGPDAQKTDAQAKQDSGKKGKGGRMLLSAYHLSLKEAKEERERAAAAAKKKKDAGAADDDEGEGAERAEGGAGAGPSSDGKKAKPPARPPAQKKAKRAAGREASEEIVIQEEDEAGPSKPPPPPSQGKKVTAIAAAMFKAQNSTKAPAAAVKKPPAPSPPSKRKRAVIEDSDDEDEDYAPDEEEEEVVVEEEEEEEGDVEVGGGSGAGGGLSEAEIERIIASAVKPQGHSVLHAINWRRVVLDEAHQIKDRRTNTAQAVFLLKARYRWALSGTPLQNRVNELYSQIRFLRINPYSYFFCRACECRSLQYPFKNDYRRCFACGHAPTQHICWWNTMIANKILRYGNEGKGREALRLLRRGVLGDTMLRRTKAGRADDLVLPPRTTIVRRERLDPREMDFYEALYTQSQATFTAYVAAGTVLNNYIHIFEALLRMRQAVCHPYLVIHSAKRAADERAAGREGGRAGSPEGGGGCPLCHEPVPGGIGESVAPGCCGRPCCRMCVQEYVDGSEAAAAELPCPACGAQLQVQLDEDGMVVPGEGGAAGAGGGAAMVSSMGRFKKGSILNRIDLGPGKFVSSTKIEVLRHELHEMIAFDPSSKAIVFSQFTSMLDLIQFRLEQTGVRCVKLEGSMAMEQRDRAIEAFQTDPDIRVFLMSLKAGGVALNLTQASHVFLMDPWWNPAIEHQAAARIHRLGQYKPVKVVNIIAAGTVEERILKLQEKKAAIFDATVGKENDAMGRLTPEDLKFLFQ